MNLPQYATMYYNQHEENGWGKRKYVYTYWIYGV
jgi:hypothetical protein